MANEFRSLETDGTLQYSDYSLVMNQKRLYAVHNGVKSAIHPLSDTSMSYVIIGRYLMNHPQWFRLDAFLRDLSLMWAFLSPIVT